MNDARDKQPSVTVCGPTPAPTLEYRNGPRLRWLGRHPKVLTGLALLLALGILAYEYRQSLVHRVRWLYWSHRAANHVMPDKPYSLEIIDKKEVARISLGDPDFVVKLDSSGRYRYGYYIPTTYKHLQELDSRLNVTAGISNPIAFMGKRRRPDGTNRLVIITGGADAYKGELIAGANALVLPIPGLFDPLPPLGLMRFGGPRDYITAALPWTPIGIKTGTADSSDPSRITFSFDIAAGFQRSPGGGVLEAFLQNDDSLRFQVKSSWGITGDILGKTDTLKGAPKPMEAESALVKQRVKQASTPPPPSTRGR